MHVVIQTNVKAGKWMNKMLTNVAAGSAVDFGTNMRNYATANMDMLKKFVEEQEKNFKQNN